MKKICFYILIFSFLNYIGCYSSKSVNKEILYTSDLGEPAGIVAIITNDDGKIVLDEGKYDDGKIVLDEGKYELVGDTLYVSGINKTNTSVYGQNIDLTIALDDIHSVEIEEFDGWATTGCIIGGAVGVSLMIAMALTFQSGVILPSKCEYEGFNFEEKKD
jgi:hypothetical protein